MCPHGWQSLLLSIMDSRNGEQLREAEEAVRVCTSDLLSCIQDTCGCSWYDRVCVCVCISVCWGRGGEEKRRRMRMYMGCAGLKIIMCYDCGKGFMSGDNPDGYL